MTIRSDAAKAIGKRVAPVREPSKQSLSFGARVFGRRQIEQSLPKKQAANWLAAIDGKEKIDSDHLDQFADALKEWALRLGATHYTHWFQPLTANCAEKHDSFLSWKEGEGVIEKLGGKELLQGEPDASSFPSGGLRATSTARGYTLWDPTTPPFLLEDTLYIPSLFFSWKADALDFKIPLLRSEQKINAALLRLLKLANIPATKVFSTLGPEQEYFLVDRDLFLSRPDLALSGRTVYGAPGAKGQELEDHYFAPVEERALAFMRDFEEAALLLGIPIKTRHNEVAPAQHEAAPLFERASLAADHNLLLMELMRKKAIEHDLACLFHEKPFAKINGSGKHCNWSLATDAGLNLLDPKEDSFAFLVLLAAVLRALHEHALLLRASIGSAGNDWRLGGSEAPPTILSVYLGEALEALVRSIIQEKKNAAEMRKSIDLGLSHIPTHIRDASDRNRTSFFAFTGNKFEFRAVGGSQHVAWPVTILNAIVADSLQLLLDEIEEAISSSKGKNQLEAALPVLRKTLKEAAAVLFDGDNYSKEWEREAEKRGLPNVRKCFHAFSILADIKTKRIFEGILSEDELHARYEVSIERYAKQMNIECNLMVGLFRTEIYPALLKQQQLWARTVADLAALKIDPDRQLMELQQFAKGVSEAMEKIQALEKIQKEACSLGSEAKARVFCELALPRMEEARSLVDKLEGWVDDQLWPLPKYSELLFSR